MSVDSELSAPEGDSHPVEIPEPHRSLEDQVADILRGSSAPPEPAPETEQPADPPPAETWDLKSVAERLKADPAKLYDLKIPLADGTETTLGQLKDGFKPAQELEKARAAFVEDQTRWQADQQTTTQELHALLAKLPPQALTPAFLQEAQRQTEAARQRQAEKLLELIPEWKDQVTRTADWSDLRATAKAYGFSDADVNLAAQGFADPRFLKMARDLAKLQTAAKAAQAKPAPKVAARPAGQGNAQTPAQQHGRLKAAVTKGQIKPADAAAQILRSAGVKGI